MTYVYAWFVSGIIYSTLCLFEKNFRKQFTAVSSIHQTTTLVMLTMLGPISPLMVLVAVVRGVAAWLWAKWKIRKTRKYIQKTTADFIETTNKFIEHLKENVHFKCDCGHASKPTYFDTEDGGIDATWKCPECGKTAPNVRTE